MFSTECFLTRLFLPPATSTQDARALYSAQHADRSTHELSPSTPFTISDTTISDTPTDPQPSRKKTKKTKTTTATNDGASASENQGGKAVVSAVHVQGAQMDDGLDQARYRMEEKEKELEKQDTEESGENGACLLYGSC